MNLTEPSSSSLNNLKMTAAQMERVKVLNDMTDLSQLQDNLSSVHDQVCWSGVKILTISQRCKDLDY